jgi:hypothetical protein
VVLVCVAKRKRSKQEQAPSQQEFQQQDLQPTQRQEPTPQPTQQQHVPNVPKPTSTIIAGSLAFSRFGTKKTTRSNLVSLLARSAKAQSLRNECLCRRIALLRLFAPPREATAKALNDMCAGESSLALTQPF